MSAFTSMLVPLETLAAIPLALDDTPLNHLLLLIGIPTVAGVVIALVVGATTRSHHGADTPFTDPTWIGSKAQHDEVLGTDNASGQAALQGGPIGERAGTGSAAGGSSSGGSGSAGSSSGGSSSGGSSAVGGSAVGGGSGQDDKGGASARW
ncbi:MAG TPA: hypothetical protein VF642_07200 [Propionibacteriaceae bacterium]